MRIALLAFCVLLPNAGLADEWTPPANPDPQAILHEAHADTRNRRYEAALAKHVWFHEHALALQPSLTGVRLSFALSYWRELGESYPPALAKMKQVRDETEQRIRDKDQARIQFGDFHDFVALNRTLQEEPRTAEVFQWLDETDKKAAKRMYNVAEPALIKQKAYALCGKYVDPDVDLKRLGQKLELDLNLAETRFGEQHREFAEKKFVNSAATLVALLVQNDRQTEAEEAAKAAKAFVKDAELQEKLNMQLESALKGKVPDPWP